jgi:thymidylate kinase
MVRGKFIVIYGANNLGKTKQMDMLEETWKELERPYMRIKYPRYDTPTGKIIDSILRPKEGSVKREISHTDFQALYAEDRRQNEAELVSWLKIGDVLAEDYVGTGQAWGLTCGVSREDLNRFNAGLLEPDIAILLDGERFSEGIERGHRHEGLGQEAWERNRKHHLELACEFGWEIVNANESAEKVHENVLRVIERKWNIE